MKTHFPDPTNVLNFNLTITPDEGESLPSPDISIRLFVPALLLDLWTVEVRRRWRVCGVASEEAFVGGDANSVGIYKGGQFNFTFNINPNYPHEPPKVLCTQKVS